MSFILLISLRSFILFFPSAANTFANTVRLISVKNLSARIHSEHFQFFNRVIKFLFCFSNSGVMHFTIYRLLN